MEAEFSGLGARPPIHLARSFVRFIQSGAGARDERGVTSTRFCSSYEADSITQATFAWHFEAVSYQTAKGLK